MAYSEQTATSILDIPALIAAFAAARGWTVGGTTLTRPGGGRSFEITASIDGTNNRRHRLFVTDTADPTLRTFTQMPWVDGTSGNPFVLVPTKVHLFGNDTPWDEEGSEAAWIAAVIECGYNHYRHVFIGSMVKLGNYTGGEIICSNCHSYYWWGSGGSLQFDWDYNKYMFSAKHDVANGYDSPPELLSAGGVYIDHAANARTYRQFDGPMHSQWATSFTGSEVLGGHADQINGGLVRRGVSDFAGSNILVPVNLYVPDSVNTLEDVRFRPIGFVPGARLIDMRGIEPGESIQVGNDNWRVFPEFSKRTDQTIYYGSSRADGGAGGFYWPYESSYMLGLAYPEG